MRRTIRSQLVRSRLASIVPLVAGMSKQEGKDVPLMSEAKLAPSGVVRLIELQEKGYAYIRPSGR